MTSKMDSEVDAMQRIYEVLVELEADARRRVMNWTRARFGDAPTSADLPSASGAEETSREGLAEFVSRIAPRTDVERVLVAATWFQMSLGREEFDSGSVNSALKDLGYRVANVTRCLTL